MLDLAHEAGLGQPLDEVEEDDPLVVPGGDPPRLLEERRAGQRRRVGRASMVDDLVVELQEREVRLRDQQVLVVALVADHRRPLVAARQVVRQHGDIGAPPARSGDGAARPMRSFGHA